MKTYFCVFIVFVCGVTQLNAQRINQEKVDKSIKRELIRDLQTAPFNINFRGLVILDGRLLEDGLKSIALMPVDTIRTITYVKPENITKSLISIDPNCRNGIYILDTSIDPIASTINLPKVERIILDYKSSNLKK